MKAALWNLVFLSACGNAVTTEELERVVPVAAHALRGTFGRDVIGSAGYPVLVQLEWMEKEHDGFYAPGEDSAVISISPYISYGATTTAVLMHELGHALGLQHSTDPANIMYAGTSPASGLTAEEAAVQLARACAQQTCKSMLAVTVSVADNISGNSLDTTAQCRL